MWERVGMYAYLHKRVDIHVYMRVCVDVCMRMGVFACTGVCVRIYMRTLIYT